MRKKKQPYNSDILFLDIRIWDNFCLTKYGSQNISFSSFIYQSWYVQEKHLQKHTYTKATKNKNAFKPLCQDEQNYAE